MQAIEYRFQRRSVNNHTNRDITLFICVLLPPTVPATVLKYAQDSNLQGYASQGTTTFFALHILFNRHFSMLHCFDNNYTSTVLILASALLIGACSSSSNSVPSVEPTNTESNQNDAPTIIDSSQNNESLTIDSNQNDALSMVDSNQDNDSQSIDSNQIDASPTTAEPTTPLLTRVDFDITVPAYVSNSLKVELAWGEQALPVQWVGDEFWSASGDLLSSTENQLVVTYSDKHGDITLGRVETSFTTGVNSAETIQITADQFNTSGWDTDNDGISNIDESIAGTDPLFDESALFDVRDSLDFSTIGTYSINYFEARIPEQRPYFEHSEEPVNCCGTKTTTIDIDKPGSGSFFTEHIQTVNFDTTTTRNSGNRTVTDNSIAWNGSRYWYNSGAAVGTNHEFDFTTTLLDDLERSMVGSINLNSQGTADPNDAYIMFSLLGEVIEGTERCAPLSGTASKEFYRRRNSDGNTTITASKEAGDRYWKVNSIIANWNETIVEEYYVNDIGTTFQCQFTDWE